jgi:hypothetical protein
MNETMIRRYVREVLLESIRSKRGVKNRYGSEQFNFKQFKTMFNADAMIAYAETYLEPLGEGSSRVTFIFSGNKVLKIAKSAAGIAQNEAEIIIHTSPSSVSIPATQVTTKIYDMDDEYRWLTAEMVDPMPELDPAKFKEFTGMEWEKFVEIARGREVNVNDDIGIPRGAQKMIMTVQSLMNDLGLKPGDLFRIDHWGVSGDGQMLLLDYGFTVDVRDKHYKPADPNAAPPPPKERTANERRRPSPDDPENFVSTLIPNSTTGR